MVDPNPARGMPIALQRYWLAGKGAAKIRWRMPHDFTRCVRNLRKYFPKNPEGLCNILHQKAVGAPPGKGHPGSHSLIASMDHGFMEWATVDALTAAQELMDRQPTLGQHLWAGPLAAIARPTSEPRRTRVFEMGALRHRALPLPLDWRERQGQGHDGAMTVGRILGIAYGPSHNGEENAYGWGDFLDEEIIPASKKARYLMEMGVLGASVDPGGRMVVTMNPETGVDHASEFTIGGATMVSIPAFSGMQLFSLNEMGDWPDDDPDFVMSLDEEDDCGCGGALTAAVNPDGWKGIPLAMRQSVFDNDDAVKRITAWANGGQDHEKMRKAFMYFDPRGNPADPTSYRLPVGDVINGELTLIFHAIYAAAALLSGAHGGLPNIPEEDKGQLRNVISEIYAVMADEFGDQSIRAPWDRSVEPGVQMSVDTYAATEPYGDVEYADPGYRGNKKRYPIDTADHVRAAWSYINQEKNANLYDAKQLAAIKARIRAAAKKHGVEISEDSMTASAAAPLTPPASWFQNPGLDRKTPMQVTNDGRVFGHLAAWGECHRDMAQRECVMAPRSFQNYAPFHLGEVVTAEGDVLRVGKIVMDTGHADVRLGYTAAAGHYDHTGTEVAIVRAGEDDYGIWVAGALVPEATARTAAKLRRSPLSGDWRRQQGHLELTAALAVNAPAFPVYSMETDGQWSLVAAGSVYRDYDEEYEMTEPEAHQPLDMTSIVAAVTNYLDEREEAIQAERAQRLADSLEDDKIYAQRERAARLASLTAASKDPWTQPVKAATPAPAPGGAVPVPGAAGVPAPGAPAVASPADADIIAMNADAKYTVERDQAEVEDADVFDEADAAVAQPEQAVVPAPQQQPVQ